MLHFTPLTSKLLLPLLLLTAISHAASHAATAPPAPPVESAPSVESALPVVESVAPPDNEAHWSDYTVDLVSDQLDRAVNWFDDFFDDERYIEESPARIQLRLSNAISYHERYDDIDFRARVSARIDLPHLNNRLKLVLFSDEEEIFGDSSAQRDLHIRRENSERRSIGLRYDLLDGWIDHLSLSANMRLNPVEFIFKARHRYQYDIRPELMGRFTSTGFWNTAEGFGLTLRSDLEQSFNNGRMVRWTNSATWDEEHQREGVKWSTTLNHYQMLSPKQAISHYISAEGHTRPAWRSDDYFIGTRYRRNLFRPWLFVEIIPELHWPQDQRREYCTSCLALTARIEVLFRKQE